jgi:hypothetical protein
MAQASGTIELYRGVSYPFTYAHKDTTGAAVPLTGKRVYFTVKPEESDSDSTDEAATIKKTISSGSHTNAGAGLTAWTLTDEDTYQDPTDYFYSVIVEDEATGLSEPPSLIGKLKILPQTTNRNVGNEV